jgi:methyl-accepting chemotaxis protein
MKSANKSLLSIFMRPCLFVMSKLGLRTKLLGMLGGVLLVAVLFGFAVLMQQIKRFEAVQDKLYGLELVQQSNELLRLAQQMRSADTQKNLLEHQQSLKAAIAATDAQLAQHDQLTVRSGWQELSTKLRGFSDKNASLEQMALSDFNQIETDFSEFSDTVIEKSGLFLNAEANIVLLAELGAQNLTQSLTYFAKLIVLHQQLLKAENQTPLTAMQLNLLRDQLQTTKRAGDHLYAAMLRTGEPTLPAQISAQQASQQLLEHLRIDANPKVVQEKAQQAWMSIAKLQTETQVRLSQLLQQDKQALHWTIYALVTLLVLMIFVSLYLSFGFYVNLTRAVKNLEHAAEVVASGDLTTTTQAEGSDELAKTAMAIEKANFNLSALVANVRTNASMVLQLGKELSEDINNMAIRTEQQAHSLVDTASNMGTLSETVKNNAANAKSVDNLASNVRLIAESSNETMRAAVDIMQEIHASSIKVHEIVSMIDKIAFQTDILALNAAVEAAHAGEQGRGFAVVANEVRGLAQRTADSARQIRHLIDDSVNRVEVGVKQIHEVNTTLSEIVSGIRSLAMDINAISTASTEQSHSLIQISQAIHELDEITKSNSTMAENARTASTELGLRAEKLTSVVSAFKLRQGTADEAYALVRKAMNAYKTQGMNLLEHITKDPNKMFADRDMYVFAFDRRGQYRAFAGNAAKLQVNLFNVPGLDGRKLVADAFALPEKGGWVDYAIENPLLNRVEVKTSYIERISDDIVLGCGVYKSV